jgi:hypothetical protein
LPVFVALGVGVVLAGCAAVVLAGVGRAARKGDGGTGSAAGPAAVVLGLLSVLLGIGMVAMPFVNRVASGADETAFAHRVEGHGFEITIPSASWKPFQGPKRIADFANRRPQMVAGVLLAEADPTGSVFESQIALAQGVGRKNPGQVVAEKRGENDHGQPMWSTLVEENQPRRIYTGMSVTRVNKSKVVVLIFEGQYLNRSQVGMDQERAVFDAAANRFLRSAR